MLLFLSSHLLLEELGGVEGLAPPEAGLEGVGPGVRAGAGLRPLVGVGGVRGALRGHGVLVVEAVAVRGELLEMVPETLRHSRHVEKKDIFKVCVLMLRRREPD